MFIKNAVASVPLPFGQMEMLGSSTSRITKFNLSAFRFNLTVPYRSENLWYEFSIKLSPEADLINIDPVATGDVLSEAFESLIAQPEVVQRFGKLTYTKSTSRRYVKSKMLEHLLEHASNVAAQRATPQL